MNEDRPYWNMEIEPLLNTAEIKKIQIQKLRNMLSRLNSNASFYTRLFSKCRLNPEKISGFEELKDKIDLFDKAALRALVAESGGDIIKALDQLIPISVKDLDWIATTTGTTGVPAPYPLTNYDIQHVWGEAMVRGAWRAGTRTTDRILYAFALSMVIAGVPTMLGLQKLGATMLPVGAEARSERILMIQQLFNGTVYAGTPSLAEYLAEQAPKILNKPVSELGLRAILCGGEPGAGIPEVKTKLEKAFGCRIFDAGAGFGFSCDHDEYQGMHWLGDDMVYYELVDPDTREPIALEEGAVGEAVFTTLDAQGWVMIRQSMGDLHKVFTEPCPCGRSGFRYKVIGRSDDMLKVKGVMVYPANIKGVINDFVPRVTGEMRIVLDEPPPRVVPPLNLKLEYGSQSDPGRLDELAAEIAAAMKRRLKINPHIIWVASGSLERSHYKGSTFEKTYSKAE